MLRNKPELEEAAYKLCAVGWRNILLEALADHELSIQPGLIFTMGLHM